MYPDTKTQSEIEHSNNPQFALSLDSSQLRKNFAGNFFPIFDKDSYG